jgi:ribonuclease HI
VNNDLIVFCDGGCTANPGLLAVAAVVCTPDDPVEILVEVARYAGEGTNNVAEYRALSHAVCMANLVGARQPMFCTDSRLVVQQVNGWWAVRGDPGAQLTQEYNRVTFQLMKFDRWWLKHVPREKNRRADWLVSSLLGHGRTLRKPPPVDPVTCETAGRPGWSQL